jgi:hypothetical protein
LLPTSQGRGELRSTMRDIPCAALVCLEYNIKDPHLILGGCYNGLLQ